MYASIYVRVGTYVCMHVCERSSQAITNKGHFPRFVPVARMCGSCVTYMWFVTHVWFMLDIYVVRGSYMCVARDACVYVVLVSYVFGSCVIYMLFEPHVSMWSVCHMYVVRGSHLCVVRGSYV